MDSTALLTSMSEPIYQKVLQAVETGKWLDGSPLTEQQRETSMSCYRWRQDHRSRATARGVATHSLLIRYKHAKSASTRCARAAVEIQIMCLMVRRW